MNKKLDSVKPDLTVSRASITSDRLAILRLWSLGFPQNIQLFDAKYAWFYQAPEVSGAQLYLLNNDTQPIGVLGLGVRHFLFCGGKTKAGLLVDFTVDPAFRSIGPAMKLIRASTERAAESLPLLYGFPNPKSLLIYKRIGFKTLANELNFIKVLNYSGYLAKYSKVFGPILGKLMGFFSRWVETIRNVGLKRLYRCRIENSCPAAIDELWLRRHSSNMCMIERDCEFLKWRFDNHPEETFYYFTVTNIGSQKLDAYLVYKLSAEDRVVITDFLALNDHGVLTKLFRMFCQYMRNEGYKSIALKFLGSDDVINVIKKTGFVVRGEEPVIFFSNEKNSHIDDSQHWYITAADRD